MGSGGTGSTTGGSTGSVVVTSGVVSTAGDSAGRGLTSVRTNAWGMLGSCVLHRQQMVALSGLRAPQTGCWHRFPVSVFNPETISHSSDRQ
jgi:hypothetical protein